MTVAYAPTMCCRHCSADGPVAAHHDRLLTVDVDTDELLALLEMAVTWHELDYSESPVLGPAAWLTFAETHQWHRPERAERAFSLAVDIVGRAGTGSASGPALASVIDIIRS